MGAYLSQPVTEKESGEGSNFGYSSMQGWRTNHEDAHVCESELLPDLSLFGVFDGHGGAEVARFAAARLPALLRQSLADPSAMPTSLVRAFEGVDELLRRPENWAEVESLKKAASSSKPETLALLQQSIATDLQDLRDRGGAVSREEAASMMMKMMFARKLETQTGEPREEGGSRVVQAGCTANVVVVTKTELVCANAGDSRAVLCRGGVAVALSEDHKPNDATEKTRIEKAGGWIETIEGGARTHYRVNGNLNLSRALGDFEYKRNDALAASEQIITATPDVKVLSRTAEDEFILVACDGIWDVKDNQQAVDFCRQKLFQEGKSPKATAEELLDECLAKDAKDSQGIGADNMTAIIIMLGKSSASSPASQAI